jgi:hypothetical protein|tara:strand:+ start:83 stop:553 length:471 start_codon:yes stop_codon:yes gene_type:complete
MDGVIADFFSLLAKENNVKHWKSIKDKERALIEARNTDFFNRIEPFTTAQLLIDFARSTENWGICSSPLRGDRDNSAYWKRVWLERYGFMPDVENCIFTGNKHKYAINKLDGNPNILVDDKLDNIKRWKDAGGIGIRYQADEDDVYELINKIRGSD